MNEDVTGKVDDAATCAVDYCYTTHDIPTSFSQAVHSPERSKWEKAMNEEMEALEGNQTFELVRPPKDCEVVGGGNGFMLLRQDQIRLKLTKLVT